MPSEFSSVAEDGVFNGTIIFESGIEAAHYTKTQQTLSEEDIIYLKTRGEMFRFLETSSNVGLDTMVIMEDGTRFTASSNALFSEFQDTAN